MLVLLYIYVVLLACFHHDWCTRCMLGYLDVLFKKSLVGSQNQKVRACAPLLVHVCAHATNAVHWTNSCFICCMREDLLDIAVHALLLRARGKFYHLAQSMQRGPALLLECMCAKALANIKPQIVVSMRQSPKYAHARYCLPSHSELYNTNLSTTIHNSVAIRLAGPPTMDPIARVQTQWSDTHTFSLVNVLIEILYAEWHCAMQWWVSTHVQYIAAVW